MRRVLFFIFFNFFIYSDLGYTQSEVTFQALLKRHLEHFQNYRNPTHHDRQPWLQARQYIRSKFEEYELTMLTQKFTTKVATRNNSLIEVEGENLIGILPATSSERVLILGADYDTPLQGSPLRGGGTAIASLLESARIIMSLKDLEKFKQKFEIIFVAFDLNIRKYVPTSLAISGSEAFVNEWLPDRLLGKTVAGAIILGSLGEYNKNIKSQYIPDGFQESFPDAYKQIEKRNFAGDFLGILRNPSFSSPKLAEIFSSRFNQESMNKPYLLEEFLFQEGVHLDPTTFHLLSKQSQYSFWMAKPEAYPAVLLTDMDETRDPLDGKKCANYCPLDEFWTEERMNFVQSTVRATIRTLIDAQGNQTGGYGMSKGHVCKENSVLILLIPFLVFINLY